MLLTNVVSKPLTPPEEYALTRLFIELTGYSESNSKSMVAGFSQLSRLSFPADANVLACMTELSDCIISCRHSREEQHRRSTLHSLSRKLADPVPCGTLIQRATLTKQRVAVAYEILQVSVTPKIPARCSLKTSMTQAKTSVSKKSPNRFLRHCRNLSQRCIARRRRFPQRRRTLWKPWDRCARVRRVSSFAARNWRQNWRQWTKNCAR